MSKRNQVKVKDLLEQLDKKIEGIKSSDEMKEVLSFYSQFHDYSHNNKLLILLQFPDATRVAGYRQWQKLGRQVKKGERGIRILAPFTYLKKKKERDEETGQIIEKKTRGIYFRPVAVFDISQTEGEAVPELDVSLEDNFSQLLTPLKGFCREQGIEVKFTRLKKRIHGLSRGGEIAINNRYNSTEQAVTLVHELAHELLHAKKECRKLSREVREMEAEAVAFVVMHHYQRQIKSERYLALYKKSYDLKKSLSRISRVAGDIISYTRTWFREEAPLTAAV